MALPGHPGGGVQGTRTRFALSVAACQLPAILLWMHNGLGYIYDSNGFKRANAGLRDYAGGGFARPAEEAK